LGSVGRLGPPVAPVAAKAEVRPSRFRVAVAAMAPLPLKRHPLLHPAFALPARLPVHLLRLRARLRDLQGHHLDRLDTCRPPQESLQVRCRGHPSCPVARATAVRVLSRQGRRPWAAARWRRPRVSWRRRMPTGHTRLPKREAPSIPRPGERASCAQQQLPDYCSCQPPLEPAMLLRPCVPTPSKRLGGRVSEG
jgi:hypothetical protein